MNKHPIINGKSRLKANGFATAFFAMSLACLLAANLRGQDATNSVAEKRPSAPAQIWDYSAELGFTPEQNERMQALRQAYLAARKEMETGTASNTPPDQVRISRQEFSAKMRKISDEVGDILTDKQKAALKEIRKARRAERLVSAATNAPLPAVSAQPSPVSNSVPVRKMAVAGEDESAPGGLATNAVSRVAHPEKSAEELKKEADELRAVYSKPSANWPAPAIDDEVRPRYVEIGLLPPVVYPKDNPYSDAKADLGKKLFFDPRISGSAQIACASCHDPDLNWADGRTVAFGHGRKPLPRNAPSILNAGHATLLFWDGRAGSLESQARDVINNHDEMRGGEGLSAEKLSKIPGYTNLFNEVFGSPEISLARVTKAIATFERTITSRGSAFDSFLRGDDDALDDSAVRGLHLFRTAARCVNCHNGPNFSDGLFHNEGLTYYGRKYEDLGRYKTTGDPADVGRFKTPTLRNVVNTAPYMHNGLFELDGVLAMYNAGMPTPRRSAKQKDDPLFPQKSPLLKPLGLNRQEIADLKAFLESLGETRSRVRPPELPEEPAS